MPKNIRLIADNLADSATLTASPAVVATLPVTNLQLTSREDLMRTTSTADQQVMGTWPVGHMVNSCAPYRHNFTSVGTWRLELFSDAAWTNRVFDSGFVASCPPKGWGEFVNGVDPWGASVFTGWVLAYSVMWFDAVVARSFRITFKDAANPAGYFDVGRLFIGLALEPAYNMDYGIALQWVDGSTVTRTAGGGPHVNAVQKYRRMKLHLANLTDADRPKWLDVTRLAGKTGEVFVSAYPETGGMKERDYCFAALMDSKEMSHPKYGIHEIELTFEET